MKPLLCVLVMSAAIVGCGGGGGRMIDGAHRVAVRAGDVPWTASELDAEIAVVEVRRGNWSSEHLVRLAGSEKPHVHERHDLTVTVLRGRVRLHIGDDAFVMEEGDVASVPHGTAHWAQNISRSGASIAFTVFSPPYDGDDNTPENGP